MIMYLCVLFNLCRFAMMEEKVLISSVLRKYNLRTNLKASDILLMTEVILRPKNGLQISLEKRIL